MISETGPSGKRDARPQSANDRFKKSVNQLFLGGIVLATVLHFGLFQFFPQLTAADFGPNIPPDTLIVVPPPLDIPPPPEPIERPAVPVVDPMILDDVTMPRTTLRPRPLPRPRVSLSRIPQRPRGRRLGPGAETHPLIAPGSVIGGTGCHGLEGDLLGSRT